jgi:uncharacterized membrane protein
MLNIHPLFVHFPIALLSTAVLFDFIGIIFKKDSFKSAGWWCLLFGTAGIAATITTGLFAEQSAILWGDSKAIFEKHETLGYIAGGLFASLLVWRIIGKTVLPKTKGLLVLYFIIGAAAVGTMFSGAHLGGRMVYEFGVGGKAIEDANDKCDAAGIQEKNNPIKNK